MKLSRGVKVAAAPTGAKGLALTLARRIPVKLLERYPNDNTLFLRGDGQWAAGAGTGITSVVSGDASVTITNPTGPAVDLSVASSGLVATDWERITGGGGSVATGSFGLSDWHHSAGNTYLNYTTNTIPAFLAGGVYAVTVNAQFQDSPPGSGIGVVEARLEFTYASGASAFIMDGIAPLRGGSHVSPSIPFAFTAGVDAGDGMELFIGQTGGSSLAVGFEAFIQKLS